MQITPPPRFRPSGGFPCSQNETRVLTLAFEARPDPCSSAHTSLSRHQYPAATSRSFLSLTPGTHLPLCAPLCLLFTLPRTCSPPGTSLATVPSSCLPVFAYCSVTNSHSPFPSCPRLDSRIQETGSGQMSYLPRGSDSRGGEDSGPGLPTEVLGPPPSSLAPYSYRNLSR